MIGRGKYDRAVGVVVAEWTQGTGHHDCDPIAAPSVVECGGIGLVRGAAGDDQDNEAQETESSVGPESRSQRR